MSHPFVSLSLLTYNRADSLRRSLDTLLNQSYENFELIINDDHSPDHTPEVGRKYEQKDDRVRYVRNENNLGYANNNNAAVARAKSEYVGLVHGGGDLYEPSLVEKWVEALEAVPSAAFVFHGVYRDDDTPHVHEEYPCLHENRYWVDGDAFLENVMFTQWTSPIFGIAMVRKSCVKAVGGFDESFPRLADVDMWMRLLSNYDAAYVAEPLVKYAGREEDHELQGVNWKETRSLVEMRRINIQRHFEDDPAARKKYMRRFRRDRNRRYLRDIALCIKNGWWERTREGSKRLEMVDSPFLRNVGRLIRTIFGEPSNRPENARR